MFNLSFDENEIKRIIREAVREEVAAQVAAQLSCIGGSVPQYANDNKPYIRGIQGITVKFWWRDRGKSFIFVLW